MLFSVAIVRQNTYYCFTRVKKICSNDNKDIESMINNSIVSSRCTKIENTQIKSLEKNKQKKKQLNSILIKIMILIPCYFFPNISHNFYIYSNLFIWPTIELYWVNLVSEREREGEGGSEIILPSKSLSEQKHWQKAKEIN